MRVKLVNYRVMSQLAFLKLFLPHIFKNEGFPKWSTVTSGVLPYGLVWPKVTNFDERILLFGKISKNLLIHV